MIDTAARYWHSARHYRPGQIAARMTLLAKRKILYRLPSLLERWYTPTRTPRLQRHAAALTDVPRLPSKARWLEAWSAHTARTGADLGEGVFTFLNRRRILGRPVDWNPAGTTRLWRYNLHYFEWLPDVVRAAAWTPGVDYRADARAIILDWIARNPMAFGVGWHAYTIARRIPSWAQAAAIFDDAAPGDRDRFLRSFEQQARFLADHLERDSLGNHLLADARALVWAGLLIETADADDWLTTGLRLLTGELSEQIHADGGHYERSAMYQALMLADYLDVVRALRNAGAPAPPAWFPVIERMGDWLAAMRHPDGEIPLINDAAFGGVPATPDVLHAAAMTIDTPARWPGTVPGPFSASLGLAPVPAARHEAPVAAAGLQMLAGTGFAIMRGPGAGDVLLADWKPIAPPHIPAHGHCSLFSYELSIAGQRVIVDSGVEEYEPGPWRTYWRSTRAHNTVAVDGREQSDLWGAFRVARRARRLASLTAGVDGARILAGSRDGFDLAAGLRHERFIVGTDAGGWYVLDRVIGPGVHRAAGFVHFHPDVECELRDGRVRWTLGAMSGWLVPDRHDVRMRIVHGCDDPPQGWYAERFGQRHAAPVVLLEIDGPLPLTMGYAIRGPGGPADAWSWSYASGPGAAAALTVRDGETRQWALEWSEE